MFPRPCRPLWNCLGLPYVHHLWCACYQGVVQVLDCNFYQNLFPFYRILETDNCYHVPKRKDVEPVDFELSATVQTRPRRSLVNFMSLMVAVTNLPLLSQMMCSPSRWLLGSPFRSSSVIRDWGRDWSMSCLISSHHVPWWVGCKLSIASVKYICVDVSLLLHCHAVEFVGEHLNLLLISLREHRSSSTFPTSQLDLLHVDFLLQVGCLLQTWWGSPIVPSASLYFNFVYNVLYCEFRKHISVALWFS